MGLFRIAPAKGHEIERYVNARGGKYSQLREYHTKAADAVKV